MTRALYQWLLWMHPPQFRREFAGEMMWIFESSVESEGHANLLSDAAVSLARQWFLRSGAWKIGVALAGALLQVGIGSVGMLFMTRTGVEGLHAVPLTGIWSGSLRSDGASKPLELVLGHDRGAWIGVITAGGQPISIADFRATTSAVSFRVPAPEGDLLFHGDLTAGRLSGTVQRSGGGDAGVWEVERSVASAAASSSISTSISTKRFVGLASVVAAGIIVSVVLLALWTRRFLWGRMTSGRGRPRYAISPRM